MCVHLCIFQLHIACCYYGVMFSVAVKAVVADVANLYHIEPSIADEVFGVSVYSRLLVDHSTDEQEV